MHRQTTDRSKAKVSKNVGIVIVSHSPDVAKGAADMVRQMVGKGVPLAWCGGNSDGGLGTNVEAIVKALDAAWSDRGVVIMVDMGGAETNSEMAIEMLPEKKRARVVVCNAPIVEGSVMAATESSGGSPIEKVRQVAEELYAQ
jgi:dihydroxyacetone kinase phosphotransfer subunit